MRIILSPAKQMKEDVDSLPWLETPLFLDKARRVLEALRALDYPALRTLWGCNESLARLNATRLAEMDLDRRLTPAILAYAGIQYKYMAPEVFTDTEFAYVREHLRILSGFYGLLRPFDGVRPYRLEMGAKLAVDGKKDLYHFWADAPARALAAECDCVVDLASREYSLAVSRHLPTGVRLVRCVFAVEKGDKLVEKATLCKMARGEMVRWMAQNRVERPEQLREFTGQGFCFSARHAGADRLVFVRRGG